MPVICNKCGSIDDYTTEQKANNLVATCNGCDSFIKNIPHDKPKFYFGKYKDIPIADISDLQYLVWARDNMNKINNRTRNAINDRINDLNSLLK